MGERIIHTKDLAVGYDKTTIVKDVAFSVEQGKILTLIGPNGSGKSTILKSITRQLSVISGTIYLKNRSMNNMKESDIARQMSILMTQRMRPELMTCRDIVSTGRYPYTGRLGILSDHDWECVEDAMKLVAVWDLRDRPFGNISDGQSQRILLARAICQEPELLIMDEPTSFLDISHKLELLTILKDLVASKNLAVIMSLHELDLAQKISDTVLCIHKGVVDRAGPPEDIFTGEYIRELYGITDGDYIEEFGSLEFGGNHGKPEVFVIGGSGKGIKTYRKLQKHGIPFAAGVVHENDLEYPIARVMAEKLITEKAFRPIAPETFEKAVEVMKECDRVICLTESFGPMNEANRRLMDMAREMGKLDNE